MELKDLAILNFVGLVKGDEFLNDTFGYERSNIKKSLPFINYILEDKSKYKPISTIINPNSNNYYIDIDNDFLVGDSGGILYKWDFIFVDVYKFTEAADYYRLNDCYTKAKEGSPLYLKFWAKETHRRKHGLTRHCKLYFKDILTYFNPNTSNEDKRKLLHPLHITGNHYTYLNYSRMERAASENELEVLRNKGFLNQKLIPDFPTFWDGDYWYFKVMQFSSYNDKNNVWAKARRKGYSYKGGSDAANKLNLIPGTKIHNIAYDIGYLTDSGGLSVMAKNTLDWFENNTYWKRGYLSENYDNGIELGYKKGNNNIRYGYRSVLFSHSAFNNSSVAIGKQGSINLEEAGRFVNIEEVLGVTLSNMESGKLKIGGLNIWGTGGTKGANWESFKDIYYNCSKYNLLEIENIFDDNKRHTTCGGFHPNILDYEPFVYDGNSLLFESFKIDSIDKESQRKTLSASKYLIYAAQRANKPSEAFTNIVENVFYSPLLAKHFNNIDTDPMYSSYVDGWYHTTEKGLKFLNKDECKEYGITLHDYITDIPHRESTDKHGCVRRYYNPITVGGLIPDDLYFMVMDPYGVDKVQKEITDKHSLGSYQIWMFESKDAPYRGKRLVEEYAGRLDTMNANDMLALNACISWNAKCCPERNRGETVSNFINAKGRKYLMFDPTQYKEESLSSVVKSPNYGIVMGNSDLKLEAITLLHDFLYEIVSKDDKDNPIYRLEDIQSYGLLAELNKFTSDGNFDRISTALIAMLVFKYKTNTNRKIITTKNKSFWDRITAK